MHLIAKSVLGFTVLAMLVLTTPAYAHSSTATISIKDVRTIDPVTFSFPGSQPYQFKPGLISVAPGSVVSFTNKGYDQHTVTSYSVTVQVNFEGLNVYLPVPDGKFDSGIATPIQSGQTWNLDTTGLAPGDYKYFCQIHPWMQAVLRIAEGAGSSAQVSIDHHQGDTSQFFSASASWGFFPRNLNVQKGTQVTVTNNGHIFHTFSSYTVIIPVTEAYKTLMIPISDGVFNQTLAPGQSYTLDTGQLNTGTYTFACLFHPWMLGTLVVH